MKNQKGFALVWVIILAVLTIAAIYGFYWYRSQRDVQNTNELGKSHDSSTWKTYTNKNVGFTFKYPANWKESDGSNLDLGSPILSVTRLDQFPPYKSTDEMYDEIRIVIYKNINKLTDDEFVKKEAFIYERKDKNFDYGDYKRGMPHEFNGLKAIKVSQVTAPPGPRGDVVFFSSKKNYIIGIEAISPSETNAKILDKILSTFKFIE